MNWWKAINLKFSDSNMEKEFSLTKERNVMNDFKVTVLFLAFMNLMIVIPGIVKEDWSGFLIGIITIGVLLLIFLFRNFLRAYVQYLTLIALLAFNISRLILIQTNYQDSSKASYIFQGYVIATIQSVVISLIHNAKQRFVAVILFLALRLGIIMGYVDSNSANPYTVIRQVGVDLFLLYILYSTEKTERQVFRDFCENREELKKFKELLDDSLPQSVAVMDCESQKPLFMNSTFFETLGHSEIDSDRNLPEPAAAQLVPTPESYFNFLRVDPGSIREVGTLQDGLHSLDLEHDSINLKEIIQKLIHDNLLTTKALSLTASSSFQNQHRLIDVILKRIKWDRIDAVAIILNDITYQENLLALKIANSSKDKIIATVSHEVRTPLHVIIGLLEATEKKIHDRETLLSLSLCRDNADLLLNLLNSVIDFHQISTDNLRLKLKRINFGQILKDVVRIFEVQCSMKKLNLDLRIGKDVPIEIVSDKNRIKEVLVNLLANAIKFTSYGGITLEAVQDPDDVDCIEISVLDTGVGIKDEDKVKLFKIQGHGGGGESVKKHGVGFGLSVANSLAAKLCGRNEDIVVIKLSSTYGMGSRFSFKILKDLNKSPSYVDSPNLNLEKSTHKAVSSEEESEKVVLPKFSKDDSGIGMGRIEENVLESYEEMGSPSEIGTKMATYASFRRIQSIDLFAAANRTPKNPIPTVSSTDQLLRKSRTLRNHSDGVKREESSPNNIREAGLILVVDDSPFNLLIAKNLIEALGYCVKTAGGGHQAIEIIKLCDKSGEKIKVILMDCQMPIMDGYETTKTLINMMTRNEIQEVPILAWTANNSEEDIQRCYECGMVDHLSKPTSQDEILEALSKLK